MKTNVRRAIDRDKDIFINFTVRLSKFNRSNHNVKCKYDDYELVINSIEMKAEKIFENRNQNTLILIAELEDKPVGYVLARIFQQDETVDNGTGQMGLLDELFIDEIARGLGLGHKLLYETIRWMKEKEINRVKLHAYSWNNNARRLYERNGFKEYAVSYEKFI